MSTALSSGWHRPLSLVDRLRGAGQRRSHPISDPLHRTPGSDPGRPRRAGVVLGGTGIGGISTNKSAAFGPLWPPNPSLERSVPSNNGQVLALGDRVIAFPLAARLVTDWVSCTCDPSSPSAVRAARHRQYEPTGTSSSADDGLGVDLMPHLGGSDSIAYCPVGSPDSLYRDWYV
jgi:hypothetical protein